MIDQIEILNDLYVELFQQLENAQHKIAELEARVKVLELKQPSSWMEVKDPLTSWAEVKNPPSMSESGPGNCDMEAGPCGCGAWH